MGAHTLINKETEKIWSVSLNGKVVEIETGKIGKTRKRSKEFSKIDEAVEYTSKQIWAQMKKGFILHNPDAAAGEPCLHYYLGRGYTGSMPLAVCEDTIVCTRHVTNEEIVWVSKDGELRDSVESPFPQGLFFALSSPDRETVYLNYERQPMKLSVLGKSFENLTEDNRKKSSLCIAGTMGAWYEELENRRAEVKIFDLADRKVLHCIEMTYHEEEDNDSALYKIRDKINFAFSQEGKELAVCPEPGKFLVYDTQSGELKSTVTSDYGNVSPMKFNSKGDTSFLRFSEDPDAYLRFFDLKSGQELISPVKIPDFSFSYNSIDYSFSKTGNRLALRIGKTVHVYDLDEKKFQVSFPIKHMVRNATILFDDDEVIVRTDYGCLSVYKV